MENMDSCPNQPTHILCVNCTNEPKHFERLHESNFDDSFFSIIMTRVLQQSTHLLHHFTEFLTKDTLNEIKWKLLRKKDDHWKSVWYLSMPLHLCSRAISVLACVRLLLCSFLSFIINHLLHFYCCPCIYLCFDCNQYALNQDTCFKPANITPCQGLQTKTSLLANSGIFTIKFFKIHCPWKMNNKKKNTNTTIQVICQ